MYKYIYIYVCTASPFNISRLNKKSLYTGLLKLWIQPLGYKLIKRTDANLTVLSFHLCFVL